MCSKQNDFSFEDFDPDLEFTVSDLERYGFKWESGMDLHRMSKRYNDSLLVSFDYYDFDKALSQTWRIFSCLNQDQIKDLLINEVDNELSIIKDEKDFIILTDSVDLYTYVIHGNDFGIDTCLWNIRAEKIER